MSVVIIIDDIFSLHKAEYANVRVLGIREYLILLRVMIFMSLTGIAPSNAFLKIDTHFGNSLSISILAHA